MASAGSRGARRIDRSAAQRVRHVVSTRARREGRPGSASRRVGGTDGPSPWRRSTPRTAQRGAGSIAGRRRISHANPIGPPPRYRPQRERAELRTAGKGCRAAALHRTGCATPRGSADDRLLQGRAQRDARARTRSPCGDASAADTDPVDRREPDVGRRRHHVCRFRSRRCIAE